MAFTTGTATDYIDLANKLRLWLTTTAGWTQLAWTPGNVTTGGMSLYLRAPGAATDKQVFVNIRSFFDDTQPAYSWEIRGAIAYDSSVAFESQPGVSTACYMSGWKSTTTYWFYANDRRVIVVAKVNTSYLSMYAGFGLPWATPAEYPFPLYIAGSDGFLRPYNNTNSAHSSFVRPGGASSDSAGDFNGGKIRYQDGTWQRVRNQQAGTPNNFPWGFNTSAPMVYPYSMPCGNANADARNWTAVANNVGAVVDSGTIDNLVATAQGERLMMPVSILSSIEPANGMALDGVYFPMGQGLTPEQTATLGSRTFRMFANINRTSCDDFFAVEEI